jgi:hypothetical protein
MDSAKLKGDLNNLGDGVGTLGSPNLHAACTAPTPLKVLSTMMILWAHSIL